MLGSWRSVTKIAGSGSISRSHGSPDPDPPQHVMDPQHWLRLSIIFSSIGCCTRIFLFLFYYFYYFYFLYFSWQLYVNTSVPDPDWIRIQKGSLDPNSRWSPGCSLLTAEGFFSCSLEGKVNCNFWSKKFFFSCIFPPFLVKTLDRDPDSVKILDPDWVNVEPMLRMISGSYWCIAGADSERDNFHTLSCSVADPGCLSRILIFTPSRIWDLGSKNSNERQGWKIMCCFTFFWSHKFHKIELFLKIELFTQKIVTKL